VIRELGVIRDYPSRSHTHLCASVAALDCGGVVGGSIPVQPAAHPQGVAKGVLSVDWNKPRFLFILPSIVVLVT